MAGLFSSLTHSSTSSSSRLAFEVEIIGLIVDVVVNSAPVTRCSSGELGSRVESESRVD